MNTRHTPGPWRFDAVSRGTINMRTGERSKMEQRGYSITAIEPRIFGGTPILDDARLSEANARLIASAPDLLAMLERVCDALSHRLERDENSAALTDASVLIAQVKGE